MGRQIPLFAAQADVDALIDFLRDTAEVAIFVGFAETAAGLWIETPRVDEDPFFYVWNKRFPWTPNYGRVGENAQNPAHKGWHYVANTGAAPVIEFDCGTVAKRRYGRMYWSKYFTAPDGLQYDVDAFSHWYDKILGWIRKQGKKRPGDNSGAYYLPKALGASADARVPMTRLLGIHGGGPPLHAPHLAPSARAKHLPLSWRRLRRELREGHVTNPLNELA